MKNCILLIVMFFVSYPTWAIYQVTPTELGQIGIDMKNNAACFYLKNHTYINYLTVSSHNNMYEFHWNFATHDFKKMGERQENCIAAHTLSSNMPYRVDIQNHDGKKYVDNFCIQKKDEQLFISETIVNQSNGMNIGCSDKTFVIQAESELSNYESKPKHNNIQQKNSYLERLWHWLFN